MKEVIADELIVEGRIITERYQDHDVEFRRADGYLNFTALCRAFNKRSNDFMRLPSTKQLLIDLAEELNLLPDDLVNSRTGPVGGGTWIHPELAIAACRWVNNKFGMWCDRTIKKIIDGKAILVPVTPEPLEPMLAPTTGLLPDLNGVDMARWFLELAQENMKNSEALHAAKMELIQTSAANLALEDKVAKKDQTIGALRITTKAAIDEVKPLRTEVEVMKSQVESMTDQIKRNQSWTAVASALNTGKNRLMKFLRDAEVIREENGNAGMPYAKYLKYFKVTPNRTYVDPEGREFPSSTTEVNPRGYKWISRQVNLYGKHILNRPLSMPSTSDVDEDLTDASRPEHHPNGQN